MSRLSSAAGPAPSLAGRLRHAVARLMSPVGPPACAVGAAAAAATAVRAVAGGGRGRPVRRVVHVSPLYFDDRSYVGGGERYATSLAVAMAEHVDTTLVSFGRKRDRYRLGRLVIDVYPADRFLDSRSNPIAFNYLPSLLSASVVHCHQYATVLTDLSAALCAATGRRCFVTDMGGGGRHFGERFGISRFVDGYLPISAFSARAMPPGPRREVIFGGVEPVFLDRGPSDEPGAEVLFVGRLLPHKGIDTLLRAADPDVPVRLIGRPYDPQYLALLRGLAVGKAVTFATGAADVELRDAYRGALVTVLPSVYTDVYGRHQPAPELLGLVLLESMACGTPVICTDVGGMPEYVEDGVTGFIVPPGDPEALRARIRYLRANPARAKEMGRLGRQRVLRQMTWDAVARACLRAYAA